MVKKIFLDCETTGLDPINHKVTCICAKYENDDGMLYYSFKMASDDEKLILNEFINWLNYHPVFDKGELVTKNGLMFDIPWIIVRASKYGLDVNFFRYKHIDLQTYTKGRVKLDDMASLLGVENKSGNGIDAIKLYKEGRLMELESYCMQDVEVTRQCYVKMKKLGIIK